mmetsp:Transcript_58333/g.139052  ORF Transcript_58333/g.139052 Transcript_58333/m.139052 type:complete len:243 (+) Transcript_58333:109-837(+)
MAVAETYAQRLGPTPESKQEQESEVEAPASSAALQDQGAEATRSRQPVSSPIQEADPAASSAPARPSASFPPASAIASQPRFAPMPTNNAGGVAAASAQPRTRATPSESGASASAAALAHAQPAQLDEPDSRRSAPAAQQEHGGLPEGTPGEPPIAAVDYVLGLLGALVRGASEPPAAHDAGSQALQVSPPAASTGGSEESSTSGQALAPMAKKRHCVRCESVRRACDHGFEWMFAATPQLQ